MKQAKQAVQEQEQAQPQAVGQQDAIATVEDNIAEAIATPDTGAEIVSDEDFLAGDMSQVDTSMPLIKEGPCELEIAKIEKTSNKKGTGFVLKFTLKATAEMETVKDDVVQKGFPFFKTISITPTEEYTKEAIIKAVALFVQCAGGKDLFPLQQYDGKIIPCRIIIKKGRRDPNTGEVYPPSNEVKFVKE
jgi:hypothetical protein